MTLINGIMLDPARTLQTLAYYQEVLAFCGEWGLNTLMLHLTDDQGSALQLATLPGAAVPGAWGRREVDILLNQAARHDVQVIPEIESFGHTRYITERPAYRHLRDDSGQPDAHGDTYSGINPCHPETLALFERLYREVSALFPGPYLHIGCDEVAFGYSPAMQAELQARPKWQIYAAYVNQLGELARGCGRQALFWGDHALKEPQILDALAKDLICVDWFYWAIDAPTAQTRLETVLRAGLAVLAAPALAWCAWGLHSGMPVLDTTRALSTALRNTHSERALGLLNTLWCPGRFLPDAAWHSIAASALLCRDPGLSFEAITAQFVERFFDTRPNAAWQRLFALLYAAGVPLPNLPRLTWHDELTAALALAQPDEPGACWDEGLTLARTLRPSVHRHRAALDRLALVFRLRAHWARRTSALRDPAPADKTLARLAAQDRRLAERLSGIWQRFYAPATPEDNLSWGLGLDQNLYAIARAAAHYTARLAAHEIALPLPASQEQTL